MDLTTVLIVFAFLLPAGSTWGLFMAMDNTTQRRITMKDRSGYGVLIFGLLMGFISMGFGQNLFLATFKGINLQTYFAVLSACIGGFSFGWGSGVALPNRITDRIFDQKHIWKLVLVLIVFLLIGILIAK